MSSWLVGLWHARGLTPAVVLVLVAVCVVYATPESYVDVSVVFDLPVRGLGIAEMCAAMLAGILPALTAPHFDGRERGSAPGPRLVHTAVTLLVTLSPLLLLPTWAAGVYARDSRAAIPPVTGLVGNLVLVSSVSVLVCLLLSRWASPILIPGGYVLFVMGQQAYPGSVLTEHFATGKQWHTNWVLAICLVLAAVAVDWRRHSVPRGEG